MTVRMKVSSVGSRTVTHPLRRPVLARLLDVEEARLPQGDVARRLDDIRISIFRYCIGDELIAAEPYVVQDLFAIIQGMVDAAGQKGEVDGKALVRRVERAVSGYMDTFGQQQAIRRRD